MGDMATRGRTPKLSTSRSTAGPFLEGVSKLRGRAILASMKEQSLVPDDLCEATEPLLPREPPKPKGGRPRIPDRAAPGGIVFVLRTGCPWRLLPRQRGRGS